VSAGDWGEFLCSIFDLWYAADTRRVSIRLFDSILARLVDGVANVCTLGRDCRNYLVVEHNGDIYPCDFFVEPDLRLGNIVRDDWATLWSQERFAAFGMDKARWNASCETCSYLALCGGDCQKHRHSQGVERDPRALSVLCEGWKLFYAHTLERFNQLAAGIRQDRAKAEAVTRKAMSLAGLDAVPAGRNDPCPCGSGKKFKKCCGGIKR
jgi:uncharacterized protein